MLYASPTQTYLHKHWEAHSEFRIWMSALGYRVGTGFPAPWPGLPGGRGERAPHTHGWTCQSACPYSSHICANSYPKDILRPQGIQCVCSQRRDSWKNPSSWNLGLAGNSRISGDPKYDPASGGVAAPVPISTTGGTAGGGSARAPAQNPFG